MSTFLLKMRNPKLARPLSFARQGAMSQMSCPRCRATYPVGDYPLGCATCAHEGFPVNLQIEYETTKLEDVFAEMPYANPVSLGEGETPLRTSSIASGLHLKLESENPTGSHKDRMAAIGVTRALERGAKRIVAASSGNAGIAIATYARAAEIACEIAINRDCGDGFRQRMSKAGAKLIECPDSLSRWRYLDDAVRDTGTYALTNYALPAVGSPSIAIEGYKPVAWEIYRQFGGHAPNFVIVPVARGDLLIGIARGFQSMQKHGLIATVPRLIAVEPFPRLSAVLAGRDYRGTFAGKTQQFSIAGSTVTYQTLSAIESTHGLACVVDDAAAVRAQRQLLDEDGLGAELCAAATLAAHERYCETGVIGPADTVVLILTGRAEAQQAV
jgi:threonine synthase